MSRKRIPLKRPRPTRKPAAKKKARQPAQPAPEEPAKDEILIPFREPRAFSIDKVEIVKRPQDKLDDRMMRRICALVQNGFTLSATCDYLSISTNALYRWRRNGEIWLEGDGEPKEFERYGVFLLSLKKALAVALMELQDKLITSDFGWVKFLAILERRDPMNFGKDQGSPEDDVFDPTEEFL